MKQNILRMGKLLTVLIKILRGNTCKRNMPMCAPLGENKVLKFMSGLSSLTLKYKDERLNKHTYINMLEIYSIF